MSAAPIYEQNPRAQAILEKVQELAVLPHVVYKVLELSSSADSSAIEMERAIVVDPGFSSRILVQANSAFYGLPKKVSSIKEALMFLGFKSIRQLAMTVGVYDMFVGKTDKDSLRRRAWWRHSVDAAVCSRWIAGEFRSVPSEDAYTLGLLHLIGKTLLDRYGGADYGQVEAFVAGQGMSDIEAETRVYGCHHMEIAQFAARKWGFPEELIQGLDYASFGKAEDEFVRWRATVALGSEISVFAMEGSGGALEDRTLPAWALAALGIEDEKQSYCVDGGMRAITQAAQLQM